MDQTPPAADATSTPSTPSAPAAPAPPAQPAPASSAPTAFQIFSAAEKDAIKAIVAEAIANHEARLAAAELRLSQAFNDFTPRS